MSSELTEPSKLFWATFSPGVDGMVPTHVCAAWFCSVVLVLNFLYQLIDLY